jgi:viroplasmin and RNaseH domain-containing protein
MSNKLKSLLALKGFSVRSFSAALNKDYVTVWRKVKEPEKIEIKDIEEWQKVLNLTQKELIEFFLPFALQNVKQETE